MDCGVLNCKTRASEYPEFCLTAELAPETIEKVRRLYEEEENNRVSVISAQIENEFYLRYTRVEEVVEFAGRMGYRRIGIATCVGLIEESRILARILRKNGFEDSKYTALSARSALFSRPMSVYPRRISHGPER